MRISFVVPAYNEEKRIAGCVESILKELARTPSDAEVVVVDNASTDRTAEVARSLGVRVVREDNKGVAWARHAGFIASTGELVANIDADALLPEGWLAKVLSAFNRDPKLVALSGPQIYYDIAWWRRAISYVFYSIGYLTHLFNHHVLHKGAMLQGGNFIIRRDAFLEVGGFDTSIEFYGEDTDVARRISKVGKVVWTFKLPIYASGRRFTKEGLLKTGWRYATNYFAVLMHGKPSTLDYTDIRDDV